MNLDGRFLAVAYGMGVDSTAMLVGFKRRGIKPDVILFADTGDEKPETYAYLDTINAWLEDNDFPTIVTVVRLSPEAGHTSLYDECMTNGTLPSLAFGGHSCSLKWKVRPQEKWMNAHAPALEVWERGEKIVKAIGYDNGGRDRCRAAHAKSEDPKYDYWFPLQEWGWDRERCKREIAAEGLPVPVKSACYYCPASKPSEIDELIENHPDLADRIIALEENAKEKCHTIEGLWRSTVKGYRGAEPKPGSMGAYIKRKRRSLPVIPLEIMAPEARRRLGYSDQVELELEAA